MMIRDYSKFDEHYAELLKDIYEQPNDEGHSRMAEEIISKWMPGLREIKNVLDVGCGTGFCSQYFKNYGVEYLGIAIGKPSIFPLIFDLDYNFTDFLDETYDLIFSRHSLEHSPFPLLTLMEWHRIAKKYLMLILPEPESYTYVGKNHYSVMNPRQIKWLLRRSGWEIFSKDYSEPTEMRYLCIKRPRLGSEGYVEILDADTLGKDQAFE